MLQTIPGSAQFLSNLHAVSTDALFTTYAASPARSDYKTDQGYQFQWFDDDAGVEFISTDGPNLGIAFRIGNRLIFRLRELFREPVVTTSYSDLVKYFYYPVQDIRVEVFFVVYSSVTAIIHYRLVNEGHFPIAVSAMPYLYYPAADSLMDIDHSNRQDVYTFRLNRKRDAWMSDHNIPVAGLLTGSWSVTGLSALTCRAFVRPGLRDNSTPEKEPIGELVKTMIHQKLDSRYVKGLIVTREFNLQPGDATSFRIVVDLAEPGSGKQTSIMSSQDMDIQDAGHGIQSDIDLEKLVRDDEKSYMNIPRLPFRSKDDEMLYWSAFSLLRQCMMPPEGECSSNYYVFSREPRWGWGYGGQVFHESLSMLAYVYMDPRGAMNSQRVFIQRQRPDGYINYRTGPYLNETIETNGRPTSSAPFFNYVNREIYQITGDRQFLKEAYASGRKLYQYFIANRDSNNNGLCEWGGHAELESVRDARVAVWDNVGRASGFEGPDLNSMLVMEARSLAEMAKRLGLSEESKKWQDEALHRAVLMNRVLWDSVTKFYYNVNKADQSFSYLTRNDLKIKEIIGFLPLWAGVADSGMAKSLVEKMQDPIEFRRPYGIPSLSAADPYYCPIGYWNGPVWVQWEYLIYRGLRSNGYEDVAEELAGRVLDNMVFHLKKDHVFWEFYSADDHQAGWNKTYIWAGIAARFLIDGMTRK